MTQPSGRDRRVHPRTSVNVTGALRYGDDRVRGIVENIGSGGLFFATEELDLLVEDGAVVTLEIDRPGGLALHGTVLRTERYFDGTRVVRAFAIRFVEEIDVAALGLPA